MSIIVLIIMHFFVFLCKYYLPSVQRYLFPHAFNRRLVMAQKTADT